MVVKQKAGTVEDMLEAVDEADLVLLEGGKNWDFPKIELVRKGNSERLAEMDGICWRWQRIWKAFR